jgi:hypothetical protein
MPGTTGIELARVFTQRHPESSVLIVSRFAGASEIGPDLRVLSKPFRQGGAGSQSSRRNAGTPFRMRSNY